MSANQAAADEQRERDARVDAGWDVHRLVERVAVAVYGAQRIEHTLPGFRTPIAAVEALGGLQAAMFVRDAAAGRIYDYVRAARAAGTSWDAIGEALGITPPEHQSRGELAFRHIVEDEPITPEHEPMRWGLSTPSTYWTCGSCGQHVTDRGPFESHPTDNESGHAETCERHAAAIAQHERERDW